MHPLRQQEDNAFRVFARQINAFDAATLGYVIITFIFIALNIHQVEDPLPMLWIRLLTLAGIVLIFWLHRRFPGSITGFIRHFYPLPLLGYWYGETFYLHGTVFGYIDPYLTRWEFMLFGMQPSFEFSRAIPYLWFSELLYCAYFCFYIMIFMVALLLYIKKRSDYNEALFTLLFSFYILYIVFIIMPSMGPHYWYEIPPEEIPGGYIFSKAVMIAQEIGETPTGAFPSSHVSIAVLLLWISFRYIRKVFWILLPVVVLLCAATVYIKAHYVIDVIAGIASVPLLVLLSRLTYRPLQQRQSMAYPGGGHD
jgi:membrane-associated phospholipid phosphatase